MRGRRGARERETVGERERGGEGERERTEIQIRTQKTLFLQDPVQQLVLARLLNNNT